MALSNPPVTPNVYENWLFQFTADNQNCLDFDGSDDTINFGNILSTPFVNFTIEFWCKADAIGGGVVIQLSAGSGENEDENVSFNVNLQSGGEFQLFYEYGSGSNESNTTSSFDLSADTWTHVAVVRDDSTGEAYFYKNGALVETETASNDPTGGTSSDANMTIGNNFANNNGYNGELAHVRIWNVARSAEDIAYYYSRLVDSTHSGLVGYYKLDEGNGTSAFDSSSSNNTGTISGATWAIEQFDQFIHAFGLAFRDSKVSSNHYHGSVLNKSMTVRENIDITNGTSSTGNITLESANFKINNTDFYKLLFNGTNNYHNKEVRVYAQYQDESSLGNCQQIFSGRIVDMQLSENENIKMQINSHTPWDNVMIPNEKTDRTNVYVPIVYGAFEHNTSTFGSPTLVDNKLYPVPVINVTNAFVTTLMPRAYSSSSNAFLNQWFGKDCFLPARTGSSPYNVNETTETYEGQNCIQTKLNKYWQGITKANEDDANTSNQLFTNIENAFDGDDSTFATSTLSSSNTSTTLTVGLDNKLYYYQVYRRIHVYVKNSASETVNVSATIGDGNYATEETETTSQTFSNSSTIYEVVVDVRSNLLPSSLSCSITFTHVSGSYGTLSVQKIEVEMTALIYGSTASDADEKRIHMDMDAKSASNLKYLYSGGAGIIASWDDGAIQHGHDAHRDLLIRQAGMKKTDPEVNNGEAWSVLNTDRAINNWKMRYWQLEPTLLKDVLNKIAYEFGFVFKVSPSGNLKYIYIKKSSELSASTNDHNLTDDDISNVQVMTTGLNELVTQMDISNELNPAEDRYGKFNSISDSSKRKQYNLGGSEGIKQVNLDMNVGAIPSTADSDCNADFYSYYNNIIGDMKIIVTCDVVNPMKGYQLETGDVVTFADMPVEMFGTNFSTSKYYMVIETKRSLGKVSITAREVG